MTVIVSMTTVPKRNGTLGPTIASLLNQTVTPDEIRLYVTEGCTQPPHVRCIRTADHGPVTKISAVTDESLALDTIVITADDDIIYEPIWLEILLERAREYPDEAVGFSGWNASDFVRYAKQLGPRARGKGNYVWPKQVGPCDVLEGHAGVAYRKGFFDPDILEPSKDYRLVDDVWISSYLYRRRITRRLVSPTDAPKRLSAPPANPLPGLHNRPDFKELNRSAAVVGFRELRHAPRVAPIQGSAAIAQAPREPIPNVAKLLPWRTENISARPFKGFYSFNPCIHFDGETYRCVMRNADYYAPSGVPSPHLPRRTKITTRNVMAVFDPKTWALVQMTEIREFDDLPRHPVFAYGYEDMRLFRTTRDGVIGVATTLQLNPKGQQEIAICRFDEDWNICSAKPIRGPWSDGPQKNWVPFDGADSIRLLYSIERGILFGEEGPMPDPVRARTASWSSPGLRGGSQLVAVEPGRWLGIGHHMRWIGSGPAKGKDYWHVWYSCDDSGRLLETSEPMKLSHCGIEFAAGLAVDQAADQVVLSFGTQDKDCHLGITRLSAVLELLKPVRSS